MIATGAVFATKYTHAASPSITGCFTFRWISGPKLYQ